MVWRACGSHGVSIHILVGSSYKTCQIHLWYRCGESCVYIHDAHWRSASSKYVQRLQQLADAAGEAVGVTADKLLDAVEGMADTTARVVGVTAAKASGDDDGEEYSTQATLWSSSCSSLQAIHLHS